MIEIATNISLLCYLRMRWRVTVADWRKHNNQLALHYEFSFGLGWSRIGLTSTAGCRSSPSPRNNAIDCRQSCMLAVWIQRIK